jgi:MFS family permease
MDRRWTTVVLVCLGTLISYIDRGNLSIAVPALTAELELSPEQTGLLLSAFFWSYAACQIPAGYFVDRFGIKRSFLIALGIWSLASAAVGLVSGFAAIFALRLALGVCESIGPVASIAFIKRSFKEEEQGAPTGIYAAGALLGPGLGTLAGAAILDAAGWRNLFILTGLAGLVWLIPWQVLASSPGTSTRQTSERFSFPIALASPLFWSIAAGAFFYSYFWYFILTWVPAYLREVHGMSNLKMGATLGVPLAATTITNLAGGGIADRVIRRGYAPLSVRKAFVTAGFILATTLCALPRLSNEAVMPLFLLSMCGMGFAVSNYWAITHLISPPQWIGRVIGFQNFIAQLAGIAAPIVTGLLLGAQRDFTVAILCAGLAPVVALAAILFGIRPDSIARWRAQASASH